MEEITKPVLKVVPRDTDNGSCHYCERGTLKKDGYGLDYPYTQMVRIEGRSMVTNCCFECFEVFSNFVLPKAIDPTESPSASGSRKGRYS
ncbi:hypothetical protein D3C75_670900 [compost metagenome]